MSVCGHHLPHIVPLPLQALALLRELHALTGDSAFLFPALGNPLHCMSDATVNKALRALGYRHHQLVGHGFRTIVATLLSELGWPEHLIERQLGHTDSNKIRRIYNHAQYLPERTRMMQVWADYLDDLRAERTGKLTRAVYWRESDQHHLETGVEYSTATRMEKAWEPVQTETKSAGVAPVESSSTAT